MKLDQWLRDLLFRNFCMGKASFDFLEGLLAVCITAVGYLLRTPFADGLPRWPYLLAEWYLCVAAAVFVWNGTHSRKKALGTYAIFAILPVIVADGTILRGNACIGALLFVCALLFLQLSSGRGRTWLFTLTAAGLLLWSVKYAGILPACAVLWQSRRLKTEQLLVLLGAGAARFVHAYRAWFGAGYTLATFHWPNIYEIVGKEAVQGQIVDPVSVTGLFLTLGLTVILLYLISMGAEKESLKDEKLLRLFLFFGLLAGYFLPYMDQSYGYLYCILAILYFMLAPGEFPVPMLLQIITFAGYQECLNGESRMPMSVFAVIQFLIILQLGVQLLKDAGVWSLNLWRQKN